MRKSIQTEELLGCQRVDRVSVGTRRNGQERAPAEGSLGRPTGATKLSGCGSGGHGPLRLREPDGIMFRWKIERSERCWFCGRRTPRPTQTHLDPRERGGRHIAANLVCACQRCRRYKSFLTVHEFRQMMQVVLVIAGRMRANEMLVFAGEGGPGFRIPKPRRLPPGPAPAPMRIPVAARNTLHEIPCRWCGRWMHFRQVAQHQPVCSKRPGGAPASS